MKFGQKKHLEDFRQGTLHMNNLEYFSELEQDPVRHDPFEGTDEIHQPKDIRTFLIKDNATGNEIVLKSENFAGPLRIRFRKQSYNLFCMYAITEIGDAGALNVDERCFAFGDSFCVVLNTSEFFRRIRSAADAANLNSVSKFVEYYDPREYSGETGPFRKPSTHSFQQEFRLAVYPGAADPIRLFVGDLTDLTTPIYSLADINKITRFERKSLGLV